MSPAGTTVHFVRYNAAGERTLLPTTVMATNGSSSQLHVQAMLPDVKPHAAVTVLFDRNGRLFQQDAVVRTAQFVINATCISIEEIGPPVSADQRQRFRIPTSTLGIHARFENHRDCPVLDISGEGLAMTMTSPPHRGTIGRIRLTYGEFAIDARARLQDIHPSATAVQRCGLHIPASESAARFTLQRLTSLLQRQQLQRTRLSA